MNKKKIAFILLLFILFLCLAATKIIIIWDANSEKDLAGYKLYAFIDVKKDTSYTFEKLTDGEYYFMVTAYDTAGNESGFSEIVFYKVDESNSCMKCHVKNKKCAK